MANAVNINPIALDTDFADLTAVAGYLAGSLPLRVKRLELESNGTTVAGTVTITDKLGAFNVVPPIAVGAAAGAAGTLLKAIDFNTAPKVLADIAVTGLTATVTKLYLWLE